MELIARADAEVFAGWFRALSDPTRIQVLNAVAAHGEVTVGELVATLPLAQSTISHHLKTLTDARFVTRRPAGQRTRYRVNRLCLDELPMAARLVLSTAGVLAEDGASQPDATGERVRARYAAAARAVHAGGANPLLPPDEADQFGARLYGLDEDVPGTAAASSLGCGNPLEVADLRPGDVVLDLGSGGGLDVVLSGRRVGTRGRAIGLDMTDEMLELARHNAAQAGATNVEFIKGRIEQIPLPDESVDVVISNCVITLSADKGRVFSEMARVLKSGGRIGLSDLIADDDPRDAGTGGAAPPENLGTPLTAAGYSAALRSAGFVDVAVRPTHSAGPGLSAAIIRARRRTRRPARR